MMKKNISEGWICGVCSGIAKEYNLNPDVLRLALLIMAMWTPVPVTLTYFIVALIMPSDE